MSISVACSKCAAKLNAPDTAAGKKVKCPKCQTVLTVPEPLAPEFEVVDEAEPQPVKQPTAKPRAVVKAEAEADDEEGRPRKKPGKAAREADEDENNDRPKKKKRRKQGDDEGGVSMTRNIVMGVLLLILLGVAAYVFYDRYKKKDDTSSNSSDDAKPVNPRLQSGTPPPDLKIQAAGTGGGGPAPKLPDPKKQPVGTPGQPTTLTSPAGFKVTFPGPYVNETPPPRVRDQIGLPVTIYRTEGITNHQSFVAGHVDLPANATADEKKSAYDRVVKSLTEESPKGLKLSRREVTVGGQKWEEITVTELKKGNREGGGVIRLLQTDARVYILLTGHDREAPPADVVQKFFDSFELTN